MKKIISILHIDDEDSYLELIKLFLERNKYSNIIVDNTNDPLKVEEKIFQNRYDVIICDYIMDPLNGLEVLNNLRGTGNEIPFILLTGRLKNAKIIRKINSHINTRYLLKSLDMKVIVNKLIFTIQSFINENPI